jgi:tetratricopeptide (TPR) repeat protein
VAWRRGHCLSYGEAVSFWALGEIVKAQAGIMESDDPREVAAKLATAVGAVAGDASEREWLKARLSPLVGLATVGEAPAGRDESFVAWRRFLHLVAGQGPLILVIEDLHWADPALLDFLEQLLDQVGVAGLLVVVTARPELLERRPGWGEGRPNAATISLAPLDDEQTAMLLAALLGQSMLPAEVQSLLLERAGGNPLYAEEFARLLTDRGLLTRHGRLTSASDLPLPESVQAVIAARLDTLAPEHKTLLQAAAVFGKVFWSGALAAMEGVGEEELGHGLAQLGRKELIRAVRLSAVEGELEYSFWHTLIRDVAYAQIPRTSRSRRHRAAAEWIQDLAGDRVADRAELVAYHFTQALVHARAAREPDLAQLEGSTRSALVLAGDSTMGLDVARAEAYYRRALELCPAGASGRARVVARAARAAFQGGRVAEAATAYQEAIDAFAAEGEVEGQGEALNRLSSVLWNQGEARRARDALLRAVELLEQAPPGPALCSAYAQMAMDRVMSGHPQEALGWADKALALADELGGLPEERLRALDSRGVARGDLGDLGGMDDLRAALELALEVGAGVDTWVVYNNLIEPLWLSEGPVAALETCQEAIAFTERRGLGEGTAWIRSATPGAPAGPGPLGRSGGHRRRRRRLGARPRGPVPVGDGPPGQGLGPALAWPAGGRPRPGPGVPAPSPRDRRPAAAGAGAGHRGRRRAGGRRAHGRACAGRGGAAGGRRPGRGPLVSGPAHRRPRARVRGRWPARHRRGAGRAGTRRRGSQPTWTPHRARRPGRGRRGAGGGGAGL